MIKIKLILFFTAACILQFIGCTSLTSVQTGFIEEPFAFKQGDTIDWAFIHSVSGDPVSEEEKTLENFEGGSNIPSKTIIYDGIAFGTINQSIFHITLLSDKYELKNGLKVGSSISEVKKYFSHIPADNISESDNILSFRGNGAFILRFWYNNEQIVTTIGWEFDPY